MFKIRPWHLKDRSHAHSDASSVQRVAARWREQHRIYPKRRSVAEDRPDVRLVHNVLQDRYPACVLYQPVRTRKLLPPHCAKHSLRQPVSRKLGKHIALCRIDCRTLTGRNDVCRLSANVFFLAKQAYGFISALQRAPYNFRAFSDEDTLLRLEISFELHLVSAHKRFKLRQRKVIYLNYLSHISSSFIFIETNFIIQRIICQTCEAENLKKDLKGLKYRCIGVSLVDKTFDRYYNMIGQKI